ncbi:helix-turn-helix domain-containing protein [Pandoraea soli]
MLSTVFHQDNRYPTAHRRSPLEPTHTNADNRPHSDDACSTKLLSRSDAATFLGIQPQTLAVWACNQRYSLPFVKIGRRVMYRIADLEAFVMANRRAGNETEVHYVV